MLDGSEFWLGYLDDRKGDFLELYLILVYKVWGSRNGQRIGLSQVWWKGEGSTYLTGNGSVDVWRCGLGASWRVWLWGLHGTGSTCHSVFFGIFLWNLALLFTCRVEYFIGIIGKVRNWLCMCLRGRHTAGSGVFSTIIPERIILPIITPNSKLSNRKSTRR